MKLFLAISLLPTLALAGPYSLTTIIPWSPGATRSIDGSTIYNGRYYLADLGNAIVHVVDVASAIEITRIPGFVGLHIVSGKAERASSGPSGLVAIPERNELYVGDGNSTVKVIDLKSNTIITTIPLPATKQADELGYDSNHGVVAVTAPDEPISTLFFISTSTRQVIANLTFPDASDGIELPNWNPKDGNWYLSIPSTLANPGGELVTIDSQTFKILKRYTEPPCNSAGTAFGSPHSHIIFLGCSTRSLSLNNSNAYILSTTTGKLSETANGVVGIDQVAFSDKLQLFYAAARGNRDQYGNPDPVLAVVDADSGNVVQRLVTDNVTAHAVAVDDGSGRVMVPLVGGIGVWDYRKR